MKNIFNPIYRQDYLEGYSNGQNPFSKVKIKKNNKAFNDGFNSGRIDYESINGCIADGIPKRIITEKVLEEFLMAGLLGLNIDTDGYTPYQMKSLVKWYQSGLEKYEPNQNLYLSSILEENGIKMSDS
jgi:hypothetical protein